MGESFASHVRPHGPVAPVVDGVWVVTGKGPPLDRNMVIWRRPSGGLWLHSVVALDEARIAALDALGPVEYIVVPNAYHRMDCAVYAERYPKARVLAPSAAREAVAQKTQVHATCEETAAEVGLVAHAPDGTKPGELAYEIPAAGGRVIVVSDLLFNILEPPKGFSGFILRWVTDSLGPLHISRVFRLLMLASRPRYADWVDAMAALPDLRALVVGHGEVVTGDVSSALRAAAARIRG